MSADNSQKSYYWSEMADLTHETQVENFGWCSCEDNEGNDNPYADCPRPDLATMTRTFRFLRWEMSINI